MEFVATGWCTRQWLRLYQAMRNLTCGDMGIPLVETRQEVTGLKKIRLVYLLELFQGRGEKGQCDLMCVESFWANGGYVDVLFNFGKCCFSSFESWSCSEE